MTGPFYSNGIIKNVLIGAFDIQTYINELKNVLISANWTIFSSFAGTGGTTGYILKSVPTPVNLNVIRLKVWYNGDKLGGAIPMVVHNISAEDGSNEQFAGWITISSNLGDKTCRVICGPHQYFVFTDYSIAPNSNYQNVSLNKNHVMGGTPYVKNTTKSDPFWAVSDQGNFCTFRNNLADVGGRDTYAFSINGITPWVSAFPDSYGNTGNCFPSLLNQRSIDLYISIPHFDGYYPVIEAIITTGRIPNKYWSAYLWDAIVVGNRFATQTFATADNRTWESFTLSTDSEVTGCLFLVVDVFSGRSQGGFSY